MAVKEHDIASLGLAVSDVVGTVVDIRTSAVYAAYGYLVKAGGIAVRGIAECGIGDKFGRGGLFFACGFKPLFSGGSKRRIRERGPGIYYEGVAGDAEMPITTGGRLGDVA